jgi:5-methylcytosine-specific restriction endonuclease McrA
VPKFPENKLKQLGKIGGSYAVKSFVNPLYHTKEWKALRLAVLRDEPLCRECNNAGSVKLANVVDHIQPVRLGGAMWDQDNLQPLCLSCHQRKSRSERTKKEGDYGV